MTLPQSKMPLLRARLLFPLLLFLLLPQPSRAATTPKPRSEAFWHKFCGFFCPYQLRCDSDVYLSSQQQLDLLNSQEFLDILELFPQILVENEKLQHTTLVRLEDHQRDLILLRYKDFFHPRDTLPLARRRIVSQLTKNQQGFDGVPVAEPLAPRNTEPNEIHLTEDQVQTLAKNVASLENNRVPQDIPREEEEEEFGTPDWNQAEAFIRDYVDEQRIQQSKKKHLQDAERALQTSTATISGKKDAVRNRRRESAFALDINKLKEKGTHLNVDQILKELEKMGHSLDLNNLDPYNNQDLDEIPDLDLEPEPHRTKEFDPTVLDLEENQAGEISDSIDFKNFIDQEEPRAKRVNRISDKSENSKEPYSDSHDIRTLQEYFHRNQISMPSKQQITQALAYLHSVPSSHPHSIQNVERRNGKRTSGESNSIQRRRLPHHHPEGFIHEPGGRAAEEGEDGDRGSHRKAKRHSRRKREVLSIQVCPVVQTWSNIVLAETANGTLVQIAQFPEKNLEQWFLEERCLYEESQIIRGVTCEIRERMVDAVVIPVVDPTQPIQTAQIKIHCCMSIFNVDLGY